MRSLHVHYVLIGCFLFTYIVVPLVTKRSAVDKLMEIERFQEEVELIEKEMFQYLEYYTKKCLPVLYSERAKLENLLRGTVMLVQFFKIGQ
jgi:hypothetical protein